MESNVLESYYKMKDPILNRNLKNYIQKYEQNQSTSNINRFNLPNLSDRSLSKEIMKERSFLAPENQNNSRKIDLKCFHSDIKKKYYLINEYEENYYNKIKTREKTLPSIFSDNKNSRKINNIE